MKTVALIQARLGSSRLPNKVLRDIAGKPMLKRVVEAAQQARFVDGVVVATGIGADNDAIESWCQEQGVEVFRGSEPDVLGRLAEAAASASAGTVVRLTADCPLLDPAIIDQTVALFDRCSADYASNVSPPTWPDGLDCEVMRTSALQFASAHAIRPSDREHVTPFIRNNRKRFKAVNLGCPIPDVGDYRWTCDSAEDLDHINRIIARLGGEGPYAWTEVLWAEQQDARPDPKHHKPVRAERNEGYRTSLATEAGDKSNRTPRTFSESSAMLRRAEQVIPLGSQTFSKSKVQFPEGATPLFLTAGTGAHVWDVDGNELIDLVNGLLCVVLGYCDRDVDLAIRQQLDRGISFSLATELEAELAEMLQRHIPCAEQVRFGKNGSDATTAAIRIARAATGREHIITCGYHGWHDWYIGTTSRAKGVPETIRDLSISVPYNDLGAVERALNEHSGEVAALILEPMSVVPPDPDYLSSLRSLTTRHGALLVFDEIITGFRFHLGGAQTLFGVTPDLACFGKAMGNGMPISAIAGRTDYMREFADTFISGTFGGEALSLAAAIAVIRKMENEPVIEKLWSTGAQLAEATTALIDEFGLGAWIGLTGMDPWKLLTFSDHPSAPAAAMKTMLITEMASSGVLTLGSHNISYAMDETDLARVTDAYRQTFERIAQCLDRGDLLETLPVAPLQPVFQVR